MSLKTRRASGVSADNAHGVIRPTGRSGCRRAPGPPESLAGLATAPFSSPTPPARRRTSPAGGAGRHRTGCAVRRGGCRRGFPCRAADRRGAGPAPARWHGAGATVEALPLMVCRVAALPRTSPSPSWRSSWSEGPACRKAPQHLDDQLQGCRRNARRYRPAPRPVRPRPLPLPARQRRSCRDDEQAKHQALLVDRLRHMVVHARRQAGFAVGQRGVGGHGAGSAARRSARRRGFSGSPRTIDIGICMSISTASNGTLASSTC